MKRCSFASIHLARFTEGQNLDVLDRVPFPEEAVFWHPGKDGKYGGDEPTVLGALGLYYDLDAAKSVTANPLQSLPWMQEAEETWHAVLQPTNHYGAVNWLQPDTPGEIFQVDTKMGTDEPLIVITTAGFDVGPDFDEERAAVFGENVGRAGLAFPVSHWRAAQVGHHSSLRTSASAGRRRPAPHPIP